MNTEKAVVKRGESKMVAGGPLTADQVELLKRTIAKGATDDEFALFMAQVNRTQLDPFSRQIFFMKRADGAGGGDDRVVIGVTIDGLRLQAQRSGEMDGQEGPFWCGKDGTWREVWLEVEPPMAAKVIVYRKGCNRPFTGIATWTGYAAKTMTVMCPKCSAIGTIIRGKEEYGGGWLCFAKRGGCGAKWPEKPEGKMTETYQARWAIDGAGMLAKCAEALAQRKTFPNETSGLYTVEELDNTGLVDVTAEVEILPPTRQIETAKPEVKPEQTKPQSAPKPEEKAPEAPKGETVQKPPEQTQSGEGPIPIADKDPNDPTPLLDAAKVIQIVATFAKLDITKSNLESYLGVRASGWTLKMKELLLKQYSSCRANAEKAKQMATLNG